MKPLPDQIKELRGMINGYKISQIIISAEEIGIFNALSEESQDIEKIANDLGVSPKLLAPVLNSLASAGLINKADKAYSLSQDFDSLSPKHPFSQLGYVRFANQIKSNWGNLTQAVKTEKEALINFDKITGSDPKATLAYMEAMHANAQPQASFIANNYDFSGHAILDIGAGAGTYSIAVGNKFANARGLLIDLPKVSEITKEYVAKNSLSNRFKVIGKDYHQYQAEEKYDDVFLFAVVHQEPEAEVLYLLKNIRTWLKPKGRLFLTSFFLESSLTEPIFSVLFAVEMLVMTPGGKVYTHDEIKTLLEKSGFNNYENVKLPGPAALYVSTID